MDKLRVVNPMKEAIRQTQGIEHIGGLKSDWRFKGFCWSCCQDKPRKGGKVFGAFGAGHKGPQRFKCADCIKKSEQEKSK